MNSRDDSIRYGVPLADPDGLGRWQEDAERRDLEAARDRRHQLRERRADAVEVLRTELRAELAAIRAEMTAYREVQSEAFGTALGQYTEQMIGPVENSIKELERMFWTHMEKGFARLQAHIDMIAEGKRGKEFKFSSEREEDPSDVSSPKQRGDLN